MTRPLNHGRPELRLKDNLAREGRKASSGGKAKPRPFIGTTKTLKREIDIELNRTRQLLAHYRAAPPHGKAKALKRVKASMHRADWLIDELRGRRSALPPMPNQ